MTHTEASTLAAHEATGTAVMTGGMGYYAVEEVVKYYPNGTVAVMGWRGGMGGPRLMTTDRKHLTVHVRED